MGCKELCWTADYCVVSSLLSCPVLLDIPIRPCPQPLRAWPQLAHDRPRCSLPSHSVPSCPHLGLLGNSLPGQSANAGSSLARSRAHLLGVPWTWAAPSCHQSSALSHSLNPHRGTISQSLTSQGTPVRTPRERANPPFPLLSIAISGTSCLGRLVTVPAAIRAGNYPAHDGQTTA